MAFYKAIVNAIHEYEEVASLMVGSTRLELCAAHADVDVGNEATKCAGDQMEQETNHSISFNSL